MNYMKWSEKCSKIWYEARHVRLILLSYFKKFQNEIGFQFICLESIKVTLNFHLYDYFFK